MTSWQIFWLVWSALGTIALVWRIYEEYLWDGLTELNDRNEEVMRPGWLGKLIVNIVVVVAGGAISLVWTWWQSANSDELAEADQDDGDGIDWEAFMKEADEELPAG